MFNMASSRLTDELFERALSDSLKDFPHIPCLKEEQKRCLRSVADKKDVFGILPTGFGKSLIFQLLPRLSRELWKLERTTVLVVTPLVAIMKDQVEEMNRLGLKALVSAWATNDQNVIRFRARLITGNPGSLCVGKYREHMRRSLGLKIC